MKIETNMHIVLMRHPDKFDDLIHGLFIYTIYFVRSNISATIKSKIVRIGNRNSYKIKTPILHPLKMLFDSWFISRFWIGRKEIEQVKTFPFWQFILRLLWEGNC